MSINNVTLMGRLTKDPELKNTLSGISVTSFALAVDRKYQPKDGEKQTDFIDCVAWRSTADFVCNHFHKGSMMAVEGEIQTRTYTDKEGNKRKATEILVENVSFCGSKNESGSTEPPAAPMAQGFSTAAPTDFEEITGDDDLPF